MGNAAIAIAVQARFETTIATPQAMEVLQDNAPDETITSKWYRLSFQFDPKEQLSSGTSGARRYRVPGRAVLAMFTPQGMGDGEFLEISDLVTAQFQNAPITSPQVAFEPPPHPDGGVDTFDGWARRDVLIYFEATVFE